MKRQAILVIAGAVVFAACDGFKEAMSAHQDVVARAGGQELSVTRLSELMGASKVPLQKDVARAVADLWVSYQLLGHAAANGDSLNDQKLVDDVMWAKLSEARMAKLYEEISKKRAGLPADAAAAESRYNQGEILAVRHILLAAPQQGLSTGAREDVRKRAEALRRQVTPVNFAAMAKQHTMDPGSKEKGGLYAGFPRGTMVPEFEKALLALKPGEISPVVQTDFGYHILYRPRFAEVASEIQAPLQQRESQVADSLYLARVEEAGRIELKSNAAATAKTVARDVASARDDNTVVATSRAGDLTAARLARWIAAYPPQAQIAQQIQQAPDSQVQRFVRNVVRNELLLAQADSAKIAPDTTALTSARGQFRVFVAQGWTGLGIEPKQLADSGRTASERERIASGRVERFLDALLGEKPGTQFVAIPEPLATALRDKYDSKIYDAGLDRAVERAGKIRAVTDSTRGPAQPPRSQVPMPQGQPQPPQQQGTPPGPPAPRP